MKCKARPIFPPLYIDLFFVFGYQKYFVNISQCELFLHQFFSGTYAAFVCKFCSFFIPERFLHCLISWYPLPVPLLKLSTSGIYPSNYLLLFSKCFNFLVPFIFKSENDYQTILPWYPNHSTMIIQTSSLTVNQFLGLSVSHLFCFHLFVNPIMILSLILNLFPYFPHIRYLNLPTHQVTQNLAA